MDEKQSDDLDQKPQDNQHEEEYDSPKGIGAITSDAPTFSSTVAKLTGAADLNLHPITAPAFSSSIAEIVGAARLNMLPITTPGFSQALSQLYSWSEPLKGLNNFILPTLDVAQTLMASVSDATRKMSETLSTLAGAGRLIVDIDRSLQEILKPNLEAIASIVNSFDNGKFWEKYQEAAAVWGDYGWVVIDDMPNDVLLNIPSSYVEANRIARKYAFASLDSLKRKIPETSRKKSDVTEMFALFDEGHYKPCAMMACSLIDGELFNWKIPRARTRAVRSNPRDLVAADEGAMWAVASLSGIVPAYDHFFRRGENFNRNVEGELNRNFLMHGMMYKNVSQVACLKLFLLLDQLIELLPMCQLSSQQK
ncbi:hypothetical protein [Olsenella uli]|uniref:hypothetical protein n=1 Tax=Olsenella uli TaxID=133926 RepID=UPI0028D7C851|nr:hypothetical protein [Olsenella uli]